MVIQSSIAVFRPYAPSLRRIWPCDESKKPPLCNLTPASESESADFTSVYLVAAVSSSDGIA